MNPLLLDPALGAFRQLLAFDRDVMELSRTLEQSPLFRKCAALEGSYEWNRPHPDEEETPFPLGRISLGEASLILDSVSEEREAQLGRALESASGTAWEWDERRVFAWEDALERPQALAFASSPWTRDGVASFYLRGEWVFVPRADLKNSAPCEWAGTLRGRAKLESILPQAMSDVRRRFPSFPAWNLDRVLQLVAPDRAFGESPAAPAPATGAAKSRPR